MEVVPVDRFGRMSPDAVTEALERLAAAGRPVALVHCQAANHEVATTQPVADVVERAHQMGALCHVDAAMAIGHLPFDMSGSGADLVSVSAHKFGGPPGAGALVVRRGLRLDPLLVGGEQERATAAG